ncbi:chaperonin GroEL [Sorangium sp. So ce1128]
MTAREVADGEVRGRPPSGADAVGNAVRGTLGPKGRVAVVERSSGPPVVSRVGAVIAGAITEELEAAGRHDNGARVVCEAATRTRQDAGDGTTTAAILAQTIFRERARLVAEGNDAPDIDAGLQEGARAVFASMESTARRVTAADAREIAAVIRTSVGGDPSMAAALAEAVAHIGGIEPILIEQVERAGATVELVPGMRFDSGWLSTAMATDRAAMTSTLTDCHVLLADKQLSTRQDLLPFIEPLDDTQREPLLVIARDIQGEALATLVTQHLRGALRCAAVRIGRYPAERRRLFQDIALLTGGRVIDDFTTATRSDLGRVAKVFINKTSTVLAGTAVDRATMEAQAALHVAAEPTMGAPEQDGPSERLRQLARAVAVIHIGPRSGAGAPEQRSIAEHALRVVQAALASGLVPGGGVALLRSRAALDRLDATGSQAHGVEIVRRALAEPLRQIAENAGEDGARIIREVEGGSGAFGYDAMTGRLVDLHTTGIVDPVSVVRSALENACRALCVETADMQFAASIDSFDMPLRQGSYGAFGPRARTDGLVGGPNRAMSVKLEKKPSKRLGGVDAQVKKGRSRDAVRSSLDLNVDRSAPPLERPASAPLPARDPTAGHQADGSAPLLESLSSAALLLEDEGTSITRQPAIQPESAICPGASVVLTIDLLREQDQETSTDGIHIKGLPQDWTALPVRVRVDASHVTFDSGCNQGIIVVRRNHVSKPCTVMGVVASGAREIEVIATFFHNGRYVGEARRILAVQADTCGEEPGASPVARRDGSTCGAVVIDPWVPSPNMTVRILHRKHDPPGHLGWYIEVPNPEQVEGLPADRFGEMQIDGDPERWALKLFERFANDANGAHLARLEGMGEALFKTSPACFHDAYRALYAHHGGRFSIQFVCDEPFIPWEFMRPLREDGTALPLLLMNHPVARWIPGRPRRSTIGRGEVVTIVPTYEHRKLRELPAAALDQASTFARRLIARRVPARKDDVLELLENQEGAQIALLYFAGHGEVDDDLNDAFLHLDDDDLEPYEVRRSETMLGRQSGTFVFLNACRVGRQGRTLGSPGSWPGAFIDRDFGGYLAPISRVWERDAARFAEEFIDRCFRQKMTIGEALYELRKNLSSPTALAYVYYGDVMTRFNGITQEVAR